MIARKDRRVVCSDELSEVKMEDTELRQIIHRQKQTGSNFRPEDPELKIYTPV